MEIIVSFRDVYGVSRYYPLNELAIFMCGMMNKKTFDKNHIKKCKEFGWNVSVTYPKKVI